MMTPKTTRPLCPCHREPMYPNRATWRCAVEKREYQRSRYDADPFHRIGKNLRDRARRRAETITRRKQAMTPTEGG